MCILMIIIGLIYSVDGNNSTHKNGQKEYFEDNNYFQKKFITQTEYYFYDILKELEDELDIIIHPQVNLASIIYKDNRLYNNELFRNIDFGIFSKNYEKILLLIEINDKTHKKTG